MAHKQSEVRKLTAELNSREIVEVKKRLQAGGYSDDLVPLVEEWLEKNTRLTDSKIDNAEQFVSNIAKATLGILIALCVALVNYGLQADENRPIKDSLHEIQYLAGASRHEYLNACKDNALQQLDSRIEELINQVSEDVMKLKDLGDLKASTQFRVDLMVACPVVQKSTKVSDLTEHLKFSHSIKLLSPSLSLFKAIRDSAVKIRKKLETHPEDPSIASSFPLEMRPVGRIAEAIVRDSLTLRSIRVLPLDAELAQTHAPEYNGRTVSFLFRDIDRDEIVSRVCFIGQTQDKTLENDDGMQIGHRWPGYEAMRNTGDYREVMSIGSFHECVSGTSKYFGMVDIDINSGFWDPARSLKQRLSEQFAYSYRDLPGLLEKGSLPPGLASQLVPIGDMALADAEEWLRYKVRDPRISIWKLSLPERVFVLATFLGLIVAGFAWQWAFSKLGRDALPDLASAGPSWFRICFQLFFVVVVPAVSIHVSIERSTLAFPDYGEIIGYSSAIWLAIFGLSSLWANVRTNGRRRANEVSVMSE